jgi:hypothetical protein
MDLQDQENFLKGPEVKNKFRGKWRFFTAIKE